MRFKARGSWLSARFTSSPDLKSHGSMNLERSERVQLTIEPLKTTQRRSRDNQVLDQLVPLGCKYLYSSTCGLSTR